MCNQYRSIFWYLRASVLLSHEVYFKNWEEGVRDICQKWWFILPKHWKGWLCPCQESLGRGEGLFLWHAQSSFSFNSHFLQTKPAEIEVLYNVYILKSASLFKKHLPRTVSTTWCCTGTITPLQARGDPLEMSAGGREQNYIRQKWGVIYKRSLLKWNPRKIFLQINWYIYSWHKNNQKLNF